MFGFMRKSTHEKTVKKLTKLIVSQSQRAEEWRGRCQTEVSRKEKELQKKLNEANKEIAKIRNRRNRRTNGVGFGM